VDAGGLVPAMSDRSELQKCGQYEKK